MNELFDTLFDRLPSLSKGHRRIAQYILDHLDKAAFCTAYGLGKQVQTSESTVVRFASEIGYSGYPELQRAMQAALRSRLNPMQRMEVSERALGSDDPVVALFHSDAELIQQTARQLDRQALKACVETLLQAKTIYIVAQRSSAPLADFLCYYFSLFFDHVKKLTALSDTEMEEQLLHLEPSDAVLAISFPRYARTVCTALSYAESLGAATIAVTDSMQSPLAKSAQTVLTAKTSLTPFVDSLAAPMSLLNVLISQIAAQCEARCRDRLSKLELIWENHHVYHTAQ